MLISLSEGDRVIAIKQEQSILGLSSWYIKIIQYLLKNYFYGIPNLEYKATIKKSDSPRKTGIFGNS
jgi:hypothetical protein